MKARSTFSFLIFLLTVSSGFSSNFHLSESPAVCKFEKVKRMMLVTAQIDDQEGYFLLDTGADALILNQNHFSDYDVVTKSGNYKDINGRKKKIEYLYVNSFSWGALQRSNFYIQQLNFSGLENTLKVEILGLIGHEVFKDFELAIDYDSQEIVLMDLDRQGNPIGQHTDQAPTYTLDFALNEHIPILQADFGGADPINIGLDSGSSINIMDKKWKQQFIDASHHKK